MNNSVNCLANNRTARSLSATGAASFAFMYAVRFFAGCFFYFYYYCVNFTLQVSFQCVFGDVRLQSRC